MNLKKTLLIGLISSLIVVLVLNATDLRPVIQTKSTSTINGVDISHHNNIRSWSSVKNEIKFCIIKSTEGSKHKDPMFNYNWEKAKKNGLVCGAYHFFSPGVSGEKQFENFKNKVKLSSGDLPPILDVELKECDMNEVNKFLKLAENYYGVKPIVYTEYLFFKVFIEDKISNDYPLWIFIDESFNVKPRFNNYDCVLWQYSHTGKVKGIVGDVCLDYFMGDEIKFRSLRIK